MSYPGLVFDCQSPVNQARIDAAKKAGGVGFLRYWYNVTADEIDLIVTVNHMQLGFIGEVGNGADYVKGYQQGVTDAITVNDALDRVGAPADCWVWYTNDTDVPKDQLQLDDQWMQGINSAHRRPPALYSGNDECEQMFSLGLISGGWIAAATSWSDNYWWNGHCNLRQLYEQSPVANTDQNEILQPHWGQMYPNGQGDDMPPFSQWPSEDQWELAVSVSNLLSSPGDHDVTQGPYEGKRPPSQLTLEGVQTHLANVDQCLAKIGEKVGLTVSWDQGKLVLN